MIFYTADAKEALGYEFKDDKILRQCFTHVSYANEHKGEKDNERLEFLGDSVLELIVREYLFKNENVDEGKMTNQKQRIVSTKPLADASRKLGLDKFILVGGKDNNAVKPTDALCENLYESCVAGIYLDGGYENAKNFVMRTLNLKGFKVQKDEVKKAVVSNKNLLQEYCDKKKIDKPEYILVNKQGKDNTPLFTVQVKVNGKILAESQAGNKKLAEQQVAEMALKILKNKNRK